MVSKRAVRRSMASEEISGGERGVSGGGGMRGGGGEGGRWIWRWLGNYEMKRGVLKIHI